jgi:hypothetical protein
VSDGDDVADEPDNALEPELLALKDDVDEEEDDDELDWMFPDVHKFALADGVFMYSHVTVLPRTEGLK